MNLQNNQQQPTNVGHSACTELAQSRLVEGLNQTRQALLHVSLIMGVGPATIQKIVAGLSFERLCDMYGMSAQDFVARCGISYASAEKIVQALSDTKLLEKELVLCQKNDVQIVFSHDKSYPQLLAAIHAPPLVLYVKGSLEVLSQRGCALVGSRAADAYAEYVISQLVPEFVAAGYSIVSGGALGADTMAHKAACDAGGKTVAVLGSGLLQPYPLSNKKLFERIVASGGAVVSPFPVTMQALSGNFPARNRVIAGLVPTTIVVQAAKKSGALITAQFALNEGREVYAVPGHFGHPLSAGCHQLISEGAHILSSTEDLAVMLGTQIDEKIVTAKAAVVHAAEKQEAFFVPARMLEKKSEDPLVNFCMEPRFFDEIATFSGLEADVLSQKLCLLSLEGLIEQDVSGRWVAL